jgi:cytochrome c oxidase subunit 2
VLTRLLPPVASEHGPAVDLLIGSVHGLVLVLAVGFLTFFIVCLVRFNRRAHPAATYRSVSPRIAWAVIGAIAVIELIELFAIAIPLGAARVRDVPPAAQATTIRVVAEQFAWNVHYPGPDGVFGRTEVRLITPEDPLGIDRRDPAAKDDFTTLNELNFPVGRPVVIHLTSKDVVHSLSLPQMRVKQDAIPGMMVTVWFVPTRTTDGAPWEINCSQLCGLAHYRMRAVYRSMPQREYDEWARTQLAALTPGNR